MGGETSAADGRQPGLQGVVPDDYDARVQRIGAWVQRRQQFLDEMTTSYRAAASGARLPPALAASRQELGRLEQQFRGIMNQYRDNPRPLTAAHRQRLLSIHDSAYREAQRWNGVRQQYWRAFYSSPQGQRLIAAARRRSPRGLAMIQVSEADLRDGRAPRILDFDASGNSRYVTVDVDHMAPRERNPFHAYHPSNLHPQPGRYNRVWLNRFSAETVFPMGRYGAHDDIEAFVQSHQLSRRQRTMRRLRRVAGTAGTAAALLATLVDAERGAAIAQVADDSRRSHQTRRAQQARRRDAIGRGEAYTGNLQQLIRQVYERPALDLDQTAANQLRLALIDWYDREYRAGSPGERWFAQTLARASALGDDATLVRLLDEEGHPRMGELSNLFLDLGPRPSSAASLDEALRTIRELLAPQESYLERAEAADQLAQNRTEVVEETVAEWAVDLEDLEELYRSGARLAGLYRHYVRGLHDAYVLIQRARTGNRERYLRITAALEALHGGVRRPASDRGTEDRLQ